MDNSAPIVEIQQTYLLRLDAVQVAELLVQLDPKAIEKTTLRPVYDALVEATHYVDRKGGLTHLEHMAAAVVLSKNFPREAAVDDPLR